MPQTPTNVASSTGGTDGHLTAKRCLFVMALAFGNSSPYTSCSSSPGQPWEGVCRRQRGAESLERAHTWVLSATCSFLQNDTSAVRYTVRDARPSRQTGVSTPDIFTHLHTSSRPATAGIRVLVKFLGMGCLDHIHNTDQVTCSSRPCCCRWRIGRRWRRNQNTSWTGRVHGLNGRCPKLT